MSISTIVGLAKGGKNGEEDHDKEAYLSHADNWISHFGS